MNQHVSVPREKLQRLYDQAIKFADSHGEHDIGLETNAWLREVLAAPARPEPTNEELVAFAVEEQFLLFCDQDECIDIARAVLWKFGTRA